jgi:vanillate O-demethylase ferredoxin subunit
MTHPAFKLMIVGRRRAGTTLAQHHHHILNVHGAMVVKYIAADPAHAPKRYAQNRVLDGSFRAGEPGHDPFVLNRDFVTQIWFDNPAHAMNSVQQPFYLEHLRPDEDRFVDQASVVKLAVRARLLLAAPETTGACKLFLFLTRSPTLDTAHFLQRWRERGDALADTVKTLGLSGHVQNEVLHRPGEPVWVDAIDEFWLPNPQAAAALADALQAEMVGPLWDAGILSPDSHFTLLAEEAVLYKGITS